MALSPAGDVAPANRATYLARAARFQAKAPARAAGALRKGEGMAAVEEQALQVREARAEKIERLDARVSEVVKSLQAKGFKSPYLKAFVVARVNPLRFMKGALPPMDDLFATMTKRALGMKADRIKVEDVARSGGPVEAEGD